MTRRALLLVGAMALVPAPAAPAAPNPAATPGDRIVAVVNDDVITESDVRSHFNALLQDAAAPTDDADAAQMRRVVLQRLIDEQLILQEAKRMGLTVSSDEVMHKLHDIRQRVGTEAEYTAMLKESGMSEEQLKLKLRQQLLAQQAIDQKIRAKLIVSPAEIAKVAGAEPDSAQSGDEVLAQHVLIRVSRERSAEQALALATQLRERLRRGEPFEELAKANSEDPHAEEGGALGWVHQGQLMPELDQAVFALKPGEVSDPIKTRLGFHLVKVLERRHLSEQQAVDSRHTVEQQIYQDKFTKAMTEWLQELRKQAYIQVMDE